MVPHKTLHVGSEGREPWDHMILFSGLARALQSSQCSAVGTVMPCGLSLGRKDLCIVVQCPDGRQQLWLTVWGFAEISKSFLQRLVSFPEKWVMSKLSSSRLLRQWPLVPVLEDKTWKSILPPWENLSPSPANSVFRASTNFSWIFSFLSSSENLIPFL